MSETFFSNTKYKTYLLCKRKYFYKYLYKKSIDFNQEKYNKILELNNLKTVNEFKTALFNEFKLDYFENLSFNLEYDEKYYMTQIIKKIKNKYNEIEFLNNKISEIDLVLDLKKQLNYFFKSNILQNILNISSENYIYYPKKKEKLFFLINDIKIYLYVDFIYKTDKNINIVIWKFKNNDIDLLRLNILNEYIKQTFNLKKVNVLIENLAENDINIINSNLKNNNLIHKIVEIMNLENSLIREEDFPELVNSEFCKFCIYNYFKLKK